MVQEIRPELFLIEVPLPNSPLKYLNSYVVRSSDRTLVIDTGLNRKVCLEALQGGLKKLGVDPARTDFFITHLHADHFGLVSKAGHPHQPRLLQPAGCRTDRGQGMVGADAGRGRTARLSRT